MKVVAYIPLHYGAEYLRQAAEAVEPFVDKLIVAYTPHPSYGQPGGNVANPDSEEKLRACCDGIGAKLEWMPLIGSHAEGDHRGVATERCRELGADLILPVDADEVWNQPALESHLKLAADAPISRYLVQGFVHFWRSFDWCCRDVWAPVRIIKPAGEGETTIGGLGDAIYHFGYAQSEQITRYKWTIHGHQNELRPEWLNDIFCAWPQRKTDLHPVVKDWWTAEPFDKSKLPAALRTHPYFDLEVIS
jgi:hypothetical protein